MYFKTGDTLMVLSFHDASEYEPEQAVTELAALSSDQPLWVPLHTTTCPRGTFAYTVRPGDTFFLLAKRFGTTVDAIQRANPTVNPHNIQVGSTLCIPKSVSAPSPPTCPAGTFAYTVQPGDTFFLLARRFGTTVEAIQRANPTVDPHNIQIGSILCIPAVAVPPTCPPGTFAYTVQPGDTFFLLARRFGTTVEAIQRANPTVDPLNIPVGSTLCIPVAPPPPTCPPGTFAYTVQSGDTFFILARRFGTTVEAIQRANPGVDPRNIPVGSTLCIPVTAVGAMSAQECACRKGVAVHTLGEGETLLDIAAQYFVSPDAIAVLNPGVDLWNLEEGQQISVPDLSLT